VAEDWRELEARPLPPLRSCPLTPVQRRDWNAGGARLAGLAPAVFCQPAAGFAPSPAQRAMVAVCL
jgi:hypothetical protein